MLANVAAEPLARSGQIPVASPPLVLTLQDIWNGIAQDQFLPR